MALAILMFMTILHKCPGADFVPFSSKFACEESAVTSDSVFLMSRCGGTAIAKAIFLFIYLFFFLTLNWLLMSFDVIQVSKDLSPYLEVRFWT